MTKRPLCYHDNSYQVSSCYAHFIVTAFKFNHQAWTVFTTVLHPYSNLFEMLQPISMWNCHSILLSLSWILNLTLGKRDCRVLKEGKRYLSWKFSMCWFFNNLLFLKRIPHDDIQFLKEGFHTYFYRKILLCNYLRNSISKYSRWQE